MTHRFDMVRLRLVGEGEVDTGELHQEFPTVTIERAVACGAGDIVVDDYVWHGAFDLRSLDDTVERAGPRLAISIRGHDPAAVACEVMTRYQRLLDRRNRASQGPLFDAVRKAHAALYDVSLPLVKADLDHAVDTWQWTLRLEPGAGLAVQLAALLHDIERIDSSARERIEHRAPDPQSSKDGQSQKGAERLFALLTSAGVGVEDAARARDIVFSSDRRAADPEVTLLNDAEALSFLSLSSAGYNDYFGVAQTRRKVAYTLSRLGPRAREKLDFVHLRPDVERLLQEVAA